MVGDLAKLNFHIWCGKYVNLYIKLKAKFEQFSKDCNHILEKVSYVKLKKKKKLNILFPSGKECWRKCMDRSKFVL